MVSSADNQLKGMRDHVRLTVGPILVVMLLGMSACSSGTSASGDGTLTTPAEAYVRRCSGCHGTLGSDQAERSLPNLATMSEADIEAIVLAGAVGMPAFAEFVERSEIDAIVDYVDSER